MSKYKHASFSSPVLKRMLGSRYNEFVEEYDNNVRPSKPAWRPDMTDWELFHRNHRPTIDEFMEHWGLKSKNGIRDRIGRMYFLEEI